MTPCGCATHFIRNMCLQQCGIYLQTAQYHKINMCLQQCGIYLQTAQYHKIPVCMFSDMLTSNLI